MRKASFTYLLPVLHSEAYQMTRRLHCRHLHLPSETSLDVEVSVIHQPRRMNEICRMRLRSQPICSLYLTWSLKNEKNRWFVIMETTVRGNTVTVLTPGASCCRVCMPCWICMIALSVLYSSLGPPVVVSACLVGSAWLHYSAYSWGLYTRNARNWTYICLADSE